MKYQIGKDSCGRDESSSERSYAPACSFLLRLSESVRHLLLPSLPTIHDDHLAYQPYGSSASSRPPATAFSPPSVPSFLSPPSSRSPPTPVLRVATCPPSSPIRFHPLSPRHEQPGLCGGSPRGRRPKVSWPGHRHRLLRRPHPHPPRRGLDDGVDAPEAVHCRKGLNRPEQARSVLGLRRLYVSIVFGSVLVLPLLAARGEGASMAPSG
jgi:hypothetical protein